MLLHLKTFNNKTWQINSICLNTQKRSTTKQTQIYISSKCNLKSNSMNRLQIDKMLRFYANFTNYVCLRWGMRVYCKIYRIQNRYTQVLYTFSRIQYGAGTRIFLSIFFHRMESVVRLANALSRCFSFWMNSMLFFLLLLFRCFVFLKTWKTTLRD